MPRSWTALALLALAIAVAGCGGGGDSEKADSSRTQTGAAKPDEAGTPRPPKEAKAARRERADNKQQERELEALKKEDRQFDRSFEESSFERQVNKLPVSEAPLYVEQYISGDGHKLYTAVDRKRFCKLSPSAREKAVASFFKAADSSFRAAGVKDFEQVVTPLSDTIDKLPALATARRGAVSLTRGGRSC